MAVKITYENDCVGCPMGCINCGRKHAQYTVIECDRCGMEVEEAYDIDGDLICNSCLSEVFKLVNDNNAWDYADFDNDPYDDEPDPDRAYDDWRDRQLFGDD